MFELVLFLLFCAIAGVIFVHGKKLLWAYRMNHLGLRLIFGPVLLHVFLKQRDVCERARERYPRAKYTDEEIVSVLHAMEKHGHAERENEYINISNWVGAVVRNIRKEAAEDTQNDVSDDMKSLINDLEKLSDTAEDYGPLPCPLWRKKPWGKKRRPPTNKAGAEASTQHLHT